MDLFREKIFEGCWFSAEGVLISASAVPHRQMVILRVMSDYSETLHQALRMAQFFLLSWKTENTIDNDFFLVCWLLSLVVWVRKTFVVYVGQQARGGHSRFDGYVGTRKWQGFEFCLMKAEEKMHLVFPMYWRLKEYKNDKIKMRAIGRRKCRPIHSCRLLLLK